MSAQLAKKSVAFKAQARTIDHLGKGQIADAPTAISELWKNSYDAYSRNVALHLFDGDIKLGAIIDNGCGMTFEQLSSSWLTVGTASKSRKEVLPDEDRFDLEPRYTQGEKGIGRLSTAFLAPVTLVVTKKKSTNFSAALIDWRLFENTYLGLHDIKVPMQEFKSLEELSMVCTELQKDMLRNLALDPLSEDEKVIRKLWDKFTEDEKEAFNGTRNTINGEKFISTEKKIEQLCQVFKFKSEYIESWLPLLEKVEEIDFDKHGTALFLLDLNRDLQLLTHRGNMNREAAEYKDVKRDLVDTLRAFVDPFNRSTNVSFNDFHYEIKAFDTDGYILGEHNDILNFQDVFGYEEFKSLEHKVEGVVDEKGWFRGTVTAWGKEHHNIAIPCRTSGMGPLTKAGAFILNLGTFELEISKSSHDAEHHALLRKQAEKYSGLMIFRDGLRVLPYGRVDNDFFEIEENRAKNAGRYYWSARRLFGQILLDQKNNQKLKDKAGREGFVKNQAARELKSLVKQLLLKLADSYFGRMSEDRQIILDQVTKDRKKQTKARNSSARISKLAFTNAIDSNLPKLSSEVKIARSIYKELDDGIEMTLQHLDELVEKISRLEAIRPELKTPNTPSKMTKSQEDQYRAYRDLFGELSELLETCRNRINNIEALSQFRSPIENAQNKYDYGKSTINKQINRYKSTIDKTLERLQKQWKKKLE